jgi:hypothetical protein
MDYLISYDMNDSCDDAIANYSYHFDNGSG